MHRHAALSLVALMVGLAMAANAVAGFTLSSTKPHILAKPVGCFRDSSERVWKTGHIEQQRNSPQMCFQTCRGSRYAGVEYGTECYCGDTLPPTPLPKSECHFKCPGSVGKTCGGDWALEVFELSLSDEVTPRPVEPKPSALPAACPEVPQCPVCPVVAKPPVKVVGMIPSDYQTHGELGTYRLYTERKTWHAAWQQCEDDDAHLLIINSEDEAEFVRSLYAQVPSETRMHAGFHDLLSKGAHRTVQGQRLSATGYTQWSPRQAQTAGNAQHCGSVDAQARLEQLDDNCDAPAVFVCEKAKPQRSLLGNRWAAMASDAQWPMQKWTWFNKF